MLNDPAATVASGKTALEDSNHPAARIVLASPGRHEKRPPMRRPYSSQTRSPQSHSNARMSACLSGKCTALISFIVAPQARHSRFELSSVSPIFSALNISMSHTFLPIPEFSRIGGNCQINRGW
jgi:hypothetical protein